MLKSIILPSHWIKSVYCVVLILALSSFTNSNIYGYEIISNCVKNICEFKLVDENQALVKEEENSLHWSIPTFVDDDGQFKQDDGDFDRSLVRGSAFSNPTAYKFGKRYYDKKIETYNIGVDVSEGKSLSSNRVHVYSQIIQLGESLGSRNIPQPMHPFALVRKTITFKGGDYSRIAASGTARDSGIFWVNDQKNPGTMIFACPQSMGIPDALPDVIEYGKYINLINCEDRDLRVSSVGFYLNDGSLALDGQEYIGARSDFHISNAIDYKELFEIKILGIGRNICVDSDHTNSFVTLANSSLCERRDDMCQQAILMKLLCRLFSTEKFLEMTI